jgi:hypothetical protein
VSNQYLGKLSQADVVEIRIRSASGEKHEAIASAFSVTRGTVSRIATGKLWKWLDGPRTKRVAMFHVLPT